MHNLLNNLGFGFMKYMSFKRLKCFFYLTLSKVLPIQGHQRYIFVKLAGVNIVGKPRIYRNVYFDTTAPELITVHHNATITQGTTILTHFLQNKGPGNWFRLGAVKIEEDVFIGCNVTICNSVTIGKGSIVGAGSVVTKDIPPYQVWAGNPARYIKDREH